MIATWSIPLAAILFAAVAILYMRLSRAFAFQMLLLFALGGYILLVSLINNALGDLLGPSAWLIQFGFIAGATVAALVMLLSRANRAAIKVQVAKHLFAHRYEYRDEWMRFTGTIGRPGDDAAPLDVRIVKAVADITESPGGLLLIALESGGFSVDARWNWPTLDAPAHAGGEALARHLQASGRIIELAPLRDTGTARDDEAALVPEWMTGAAEAWALVPLVHYDRLQGAVLLARPMIDRKLDWEDFDLLRVVGRQAASYLAEANGQEALSDARRFDEFNRRFAFIMHDIKNLVSQLSLVARNAERHADNPEFRADMVATLQSSVGKMNDLLARLSQHNKGKHEDPRSVSATRLVESVAASRKGQHPVVSMVTGDPVLMAEPVRLDQALGHLVQNAIDASPANEPVVLKVIDRGSEIAIEVRDKGVGMSRDFIRTKLFKPFASTKNDGFGVGAYEARSLVMAMGGRVEVDSDEGMGSVFTVILPAAGLSLHPEKQLEPQ
ncbi:XrtA/PEP-CTERM system histidine kinase PrsK [Sphingobium boeckii]|uniref:histidine kinase n=1 Tax=Sphingobium boeckii TaxID=1082345 RepID=A0A7W9EE88_9SPHN|nr:XrtA/PEP-CTERM system histidine kinase PrsK [Sphingobium boeckii]MBB5684426.1 putative PEP-CTERM system histidine kinase [Sphingobium boeckii]